MKILVVGAGIVGLATAWRLMQDGHAVEVIEQAAEPGLGASRANGAQLSYSYVAPLAEPGLLRQLPGLLRNKAGPSRLRPGLDPFQWRWMLRFLRAGAAAPFRATVTRLSALAAQSRSVLHGAADLMAEPFAWQRRGKLVVYSSARAMESALRLAAFQAGLGVRRDPLDRAACLALEPALEPIAHRLVGGLFSPGDESCDPHLLCLALARVCARAADPVRFHFGVRARRFEKAGRRIVSLLTDAGALTADLYVVAAGLGSRTLAGTVGLDLPLYPITGYSLTAPIPAGAPAPNLSVTDSHRRIVLARLEGRLRLAGMADFVGGRTADADRRLAVLQANAVADLPAAADWTRAERWTGHRPATPKGAPILGRTGYDNLILNVGHGAFGLTLALGSAEAIAAEIAGRRVAAPVADFTLARA